MDDPSWSSATLLFGGVNTAKYSGELHTMPIPSVNGVYYLPSVLFTGIAVQGTSSASASSLISSDLPANMVLDWGMMYAYLPNSVVEGIYSDLGVTFDPETQIAFINCTIAQKNYNISFTFTDFDIVVPVSTSGSSN